jgi:hypothetical protein
MNCALPSTFGSRSRLRSDIDEVDLGGQVEQCLSQGLSHDVTGIAVHAARISSSQQQRFRSLGKSNKHL